MAKKKGVKKGVKQVGKDLTPAQQEAVEARKAAQEKKRLERAEQQQLAQIINLHIAGYSLAEIGTAIGATAEEVDKMIQGSSTRYIKNQPALRAYVRNYVSGKYTALLDTVWDQATDKTDPRMLEAQDRAMKLLNNMAKLHGAVAPEQKEITLDSTPEAVERLVNVLAAQRGQGYDMDIFDGEVVEGEVLSETVHQAAEQSAKALEVSGNRVEDGDDPL